jgi:hypothetical protein
MSGILRNLTPFLLCGLLLGCDGGGGAGAIKKLSAAKTQEERFYALNDAAKESFVMGKTEDARKYAQELMAPLPNFKGNWNYGNAVQDANLVLGRLAFREGHIDEAKRYLIAAGTRTCLPY